MLPSPPRTHTLFVTKAWLGGVGLAAGLLGMVTERRWVVWIATGLMGAAFLLRLAERRAP